MPDARSEFKTPQQPQIQRRIQPNMSLFHFISLAEQSGLCNRRQAAVCFPKSKPKRRRRGEYIFTTTHDRWKPAWLHCFLYKLSLTGVPHRHLSSTIFDSSPGSPRFDSKRGYCLSKYRKLYFIIEHSSSIYLLESFTWISIQILHETTWLN